MEFLGEWLMLPLDEHIKDQLEQLVADLEGLLNSDFMSIISEIGYPLDICVQDAIERRHQ